jgi:hypothetical protein
VLRFLDVDDAVELRRSEANPTVRLRARRVHELAHDTAVGRGPVLRAVKAAVKLAAPARVRRQALAAVDRTAVEKAPRATDPALIQQLRERFAEEVVATSEYLHRDLVGLWGYDDLRRS